MCTPWYVLDLCTKDEGDRAYGLGEVSEQTHRQTDRGPYAINNIDTLNSAGDEWQWLKWSFSISTKQ